MAIMKTLTVGGQTYTVQDPAAVSFEQPQQLTPQQQTQAQSNLGVWSNKDIADRLCPAFAESGGVVACRPVEGYPLGVVSGIKPVQSGSGDPSPDNIRPITGHTAVKLTHCGKNLIDPVRLLEACEADRVTLDGDVFTTTFVSGGIHVNYYTAKRVSFPKGTYTFSFIPTSEEASAFLFVYAKGTRTNIVPHKALSASDPSYTFTAEEEFEPCLAGDSTGNNLGTYSFKLQLEEGSAATDYEPYRGDTFTLDLGQTVYGGSLEWATGLLTLTNKGVAMKDLVWRLANASSTGGHFATNLDDCPCRSFVGEPVLCNAFTPVSQTDSADVYSVHTGKNNKIVVGSYYFATSATVCIGNSRGQTLEEFTAELAENDAFLVYPLAEPTTIQLTAQEITALSGVNTLYSDTGDTCVTGRADPRVVIQDQQELISNILSRIAALEAAAVNNT